MYAKQASSETMKLQIFCLLFFAGTEANNINKTVVNKEINTNLTADTVPNIPFEKFGGKYYYLGAIYEGNYHQALQFCSYNGMSLLSIESKEENDFLWEKLKPLFGTGKYHFWTSGTTLPDDQWVWLSTGKPVLFTNWFPDQPDNSGNNEKCIEIRYEHINKDLMWNDQDCSISRHVICETLEVTHKLA